MHFKKDVTLTALSFEFALTPPARTHDVAIGKCVTHAMSIDCFHFHEAEQGVFRCVLLSKLLDNSLGKMLIIIRKQRGIRKLLHEPVDVQGSLEDGSSTGWRRCRVRRVSHLQRIPAR